MSAGGIVLRGLTKRYGATIALAGVDLELRPGEVLGIAGPNGAGKSTLMRVIAGEERADRGELSFDGRSWSPTADWRSVAVVHQEPQLFPNLTVAENILVGREDARVGRPRLGAADAKVMQAFGIDKFADRLLGDCTLATQQRTEIARAVARDARVFLFDEPNSALTDEESDELFREIHKLAAGGRIVLLVTHRLGDLVEHTSRVAVIRDGRVRAILQGEALNEDGLARQLVVDSGADPVARSEHVAASAKPPLLVLEHWSHVEAFRDIRLEAAPGRILALLGVEGSGARELLRSLAGLETCVGRLEIAGRTGAPARRLCAYVPATRLHSLYGNFSVGENLLARLGKPEIAGFGMVLKTTRMRRLAMEAVNRFSVKTASIARNVRSLSGGNQQKVAIAQALAREPRLLLLEEPTRGVDVQSKRDIYRLLRDFAEAGNVVILFSTEVLEVYEAADCAYVVADGRLSAPIWVRQYAHIESLASDITRMERHEPANAATGPTALPGR